MTKTVLQRIEDWTAKGEPVGSLLGDCADEIERLTRELDALKRTREQEKDYADTCYENERLRAALQEIADSHECPELPQMARDALRGAHEPPATPVERLEPDGRMYRWCQHGAGFGVKCPTCFGLPLPPSVRRAERRNGDG